MNVYFQFARYGLWTLPLPARMIVDNDGVIRYAAISADYTVRPDPEDTIAALHSIV